jgi:Domain of unknown function (DUF4260)
MEATIPRNGRALPRAAYAGLAVALLTLAVLEAATHGTGWWQLAAFGCGPDLALIYGMSGGLARGQLHGRAVPAYNLVHRFWCPAALAAFAASGLIPIGFFVGALAWGFHIALDRALGYGLRTRDGFQRA